MKEPIWAEINLEAIRHNIKEIRKMVGPNREIMAVVKANGYGHGAVPVARVALEAGATRLAVARLSEAQELRRAGLKVPILLLGYISPDQIGDALEYNVTLTVFRFDLAKKIAAIAQGRGQRATVHLKVDTGMGRIGFTPDEEGLAEITAVCALNGLDVEGIYTHFATADEQDKSYTRWQFKRFMLVLNRLEEQGITFSLRHCANSAAIMEFPETYLDLVRPGIILYGLYPSEEVDKGKLLLQPAMTLKARITHVKKVNSGTKISYGCTYTVPQETDIASLPLGYADGYPRLLSSKGQVLVKGKRARVVGRVCMDQCMVDVGHIAEVKVHDEVIIFGGAELPVEEVATWLGTINYEVVCWVGSRVPRVYIG
ncbi:alanine racemase [Desulforamulus reducens MI-1]|uniref:Alanine racemase n=1 Tax=Desulforamulus reducens (strain ATCC BAA-1160 / DSM 100696 / MI-1) TaxID=349161 RepID=ALR_DESRM|nr:alanine racemase [Desulforamulus reducens]A4J8G6.1 RecName: Full=Alanine racemase [Desulforamulus reducens MI-1]ABO51369.1 alanine racemase [Desulforamulus reducens MI-1]